jgi:hypothetical protein
MMAQIHSTLVLAEWDKLIQIASHTGGPGIVVNGKSLDLAAVVAVAR